MGTYALPSPTGWVTCSWWCHKDRNPPSGEPGTDYGSDWGSELYAVADGVVTAVKVSTSDATGRFIQYRLDDGRSTRSLHLSDVYVHVGQRISRGQVIGRTGGSGFGSEHGYGSHVHQTLWPGEPWAAPTIDFELYVGEPPPPPPPPEPERKQTMRIARNTDEEGGSVRFYTENGFAYVGSPADRDLLAHFINDDKVPFHPDGTADVRVFNNLQLDIINSYIQATNHPGSGPDKSSQLATPAWIAGFFLGLIGLVEVIRLVVDVIT